MAFSYDVHLSRDFEASFPPRCIACNREGPDATHTFSVRSNAWLSLFTWWLPGGKVSVSAPTCSSCVKSLRREKLKQTVLDLSAGGLAIAAAIKFFGPFPQTYGKFVLLGIALLLLLPYFLVRALCPPRFDISISGSDISYEFKDRQYAYEFAERNNATVEYED